MRVSAWMQLGVGWRVKMAASVSTVATPVTVRPAFTVHFASTRQVRVQAQAALVCFDLSLWTYRTTNKSYNSYIRALWSLITSMRKLTAFRLFGSHFTGYRIKREHIERTAEYIGLLTKWSAAIHENEPDIYKQSKKISRALNGAFFIDSCNET